MITRHQSAANDYAHRYISAWHTHDPVAVANMHTTDTVFTSTATGLAATGRDELLKALTDVFRSWPDLRFAPQRVYGDGDVIFVESVITVTQAQPMTFSGVEVLPNGQPVRSTVVDLIHLRDGLVANKHSYVDQLAYLQAMGRVVTAIA